jgi:hypothetical protein
MWRFIGHVKPSPARSSAYAGDQAVLWSTTGRDVLPLARAPHRGQISASAQAERVVELAGRKVLWARIRQRRVGELRARSS